MAPARAPLHLIVLAAALGLACAGEVPEPDYVTDPDFPYGEGELPDEYDPHEDEAIWEDEQAESEAALVEDEEDGFEGPDLPPLDDEEGTDPDPDEGLAAFEPADEEELGDAVLLFADEPTTQAQPAKGYYWVLPSKKGAKNRKRHWLMTPGGKRFFAVGANNVMRLNNTDGYLIGKECTTTQPKKQNQRMRSYLAKLGSKQQAAEHIWKTLRRKKSGDGDNFSGLHFNTVGSFSDSADWISDDDKNAMMLADVNANGGVLVNYKEPQSPITKLAPYSKVLMPGVSSSSSFVLRNPAGAPLKTAPSHNMGDPFNPAFVEYLRGTWDPARGRYVAKVSIDGNNRVRLVTGKWLPDLRPDDKKLLMYHIGNEIGLFDHPLHWEEGVRDLRKYIWSACPVGLPSPGELPGSIQCAPHAFLHFLASRHKTGNDIDKLNKAWNLLNADGSRKAGAFGSWQELLDRKPTPGYDRPEHGPRYCPKACRADLLLFMGLLHRKWVAAVTTAVRAVDPNHLISSPRMHVGGRKSYCWWGLDNRKDANCRDEWSAEKRPLVNGKRLTQEQVRALPDDHPHKFDWLMFGESVTDDAPKGYDPAPWRRFRCNKRVRGRCVGPGFDLVAVNMYSPPGLRFYERGWAVPGLHKVAVQAKMPIYVSEFGIRTQMRQRDSDKEERAPTCTAQECPLRSSEYWNDKGGAPAFISTDLSQKKYGSRNWQARQRTRGHYYDYDLTRFLKMRWVVGVSFHKWSDYYGAKTKTDGGTTKYCVDGINMGLVNLSGDKYDHMTNTVRKVNKSIKGRIKKLTGF